MLGADNSRLKADNARLLAVESDNSRLQRELASAAEARESLQRELHNSEACNAIVRARVTVKQEQVAVKREQVGAATAEAEQARSQADTAAAQAASAQGEVE